MEKFRILGLNESILKSIKETNFTDPSEIQEKSIPLVLAGKDIIAGSATGSGKTFAFGAGILQKTEKRKGIQALILTPTRELAEQVCGSLRSFSKYNMFNIVPVYGGVSIENQIYKLRSAEIVVGTPGRVLDHINKRTIDLRNVKILVLDEADRMLDMGFIKDVEKIIRMCPEKRQTLLFSATIHPEIIELSRRYMKNPIEVSAEQHVDKSLLKQIYYETPQRMKLSLLVYLLKKEESKLAIIFCNTRRISDIVNKSLNSNGINSSVIHGGLHQNKRTNIIKDFHDHKLHVLVCTDIAARGIDIKNITHVYNYDLPKSSKDYIHRIGRTARAGEEGIAINIVSERDYENLNNILSDDSINITPEEIPKNLPPVKFEYHEDKRRGFNEHRRDNYQGGFRSRGNFSHKRRDNSYSRENNHSRNKVFAYAKEI